MNVTLLIIIVLVVIIVSITRLGGIKVSIHFFKWVAGLYGLILIASLIVLYLLPVDQRLQGGETYPQAVNGVNFYELGRQGKFDQTEGIHRIDLQTFDYHGANLVVNNIQGIMVFVERKNADDGIVTARFYTSNILANGSDLSDEVNPPLLTLNNDTIDISLRSPKEITCYSFQYELPIRQFLTGAETESQINHSMNINVALYLEVPKNMQVKGLGAEIQLVNEGDSNTD